MKEHIVVMLHPDYQYDSTLVPGSTVPIQRGEADVSSRYHRTGMFRERERV